MKKSPEEKAAAKAAKAAAKLANTNPLPPPTGSQNPPNVLPNISPIPAHNPRYSKMEQGDPAIFHEGYMPIGFTKTYGRLADEDMIETAHRIFNADDGFLFLFNARSNMLFTVVVPKKFSNLDPQTMGHYRADARSVILKSGTELDQIETHCKKVAANLKYNKIR